MTRTLLTLGSLALLALGACTSHDPLYRSEPDVPAGVLVSAGAGRAPEDAAALVLLVDLGAHHTAHAPEPETLATALEMLASRWVRGDLGGVHAALAADAARTLAVDEAQDPIVRINACDVLDMDGDVATLEAVAGSALDPLIAEHASECLARSGARP